MRQHHAKLRRPVVLGASGEIGNVYPNDFENAHSHWHTELARCANFNESQHDRPATCCANRRVLTASEANRLVRRHWEVENNLLLVPYMAFDEDRSRNRRENAEVNLDVSRMMVLNAVQQDDTSMG